MAQRPWETLRVVNAAGKQHPLPKHPEQWRPKFNPDNGVPPKEHINNYMVVINLKYVSKEDVVCKKKIILLKEKLLLGTSLYLLTP